MRFSPNILASDQTELDDDFDDDFAMSAAMGGRMPTPEQEAKTRMIRKKETVLRLRNEYQVALVSIATRIYQHVFMPPERGMRADQVIAEAKALLDESIRLSRETFPSETGQAL